MSKPLRESSNTPRQVDAVPSWTPHRRGWLCALTCAAALAAIAAGPRAAGGQPRGDEARRGRPRGVVRVALAPLSTLGTDARGRAIRGLGSAVAAALREVPDAEVVAGRAVTAAIRKAGKPELGDCEGDAACLAELGRLLGCRYVVSGEVGGLGAASVVYLELIDVDRRAELRSTTLELSGSRDTDRDRARAAAVKLLAPRRYTGRLRVDVDVEGAELYVDGRRVGRSPAAPIALPVGAHALRVTHPEFRDFIRFVDVAFDAEARVTASLQQFPVVASDIRQTPGGAAGRGSDGDTDRAAGRSPWYRRWYAVVGLGAVALVGTAVVVGVLADGIDADRERVVGAPAMLQGAMLTW